VSFNTIITYAEHLVPILLAFYIGSWSDHFGRKIFLGMCMTGKILQALANLLNAIYLSSWNRWVWLATVMPPQSLTGGFLTFVMMTYSFISDNSTPRERTIRLGVLSFCWRLSNPIATALGGLLFQQGGYICVFSSSLLLFVLGSITGLVRLWNFKEHIGSKNKHSLGYFLHPRHVTDSFRVVFKKRSDHKELGVSNLKCKLNTMKKKLFIRYFFIEVQ